jgi:lipoprotein signal peptidase
MTRRSFRGLFWTVVAIGLALDLGTKYAMFRALWRPSGEGRCEIIPGVFRLIAQFTDAPIETGWRAPLQRLNGPVLPRVNQGALFGVGGDFQKHANAFFAVVSVCAAVAILWWVRHPAAAADRTLCLALGLILAGTLGNLFDRVVFHGVRDFLYFYWFEWPVFNFADCFLVAGAGLLLLQSFFASNEKQQPESTAAELAATASKGM